MASGFTLDTSKFKSSKEMERKLDRAVRGVARYWDGRVEAAMKTKAPWTDRTSNARNGLRAFAATTARGHAIIMTHSVHYGIYLERSNGARYAIILPTLQEYAPKVMRTLTKILDRLDAAAGGST